MREASPQVYRCIYTLAGEGERKRERERGGKRRRGEDRNEEGERGRGGREQSLHRYLEPPNQHTFRHFQGSKHTCPRSIWDRIQSLVTDAFPVQDVLINDLYSCPPPPPPPPVPGTEAHGGYTYCGFAALRLLGQCGLCDVRRLLVSPSLPPSLPTSLPPSFPPSFPPFLPPSLPSLPPSLSILYSADCFNTVSTSIV